DVQLGAQEVTGDSWGRKKESTNSGEERRRGRRGNKSTNRDPKRERTDETKMVSDSGTWSDNTEKH
ncbi:Hypothetical predicted protein, partial [Xyrichtys novacula]